MGLTEPLDVPVDSANEADIKAVCLTELTWKPFSILSALMGSAKGIFCPLLVKVAAH